ncbi:hypothetical protein A3K01_04160 [candidate division WWE3 bacterium RIFOXYD1_FULL_43_17]|uniref:Uncharacterized protein n=2 Tax=Katanobacteria TaxID=422282 RepID=A0A1F4XE00_UNCKA|nr:MAG: hypothetical protein UU59_C0015G0007 [candidate division WWE3 bacterium GW2011_GWE1_41_27]OGC79886.1 MAG: hypothetical protein A3K01_04160 [candidate division WWE3 bacterium RIFOXYD1_FULL_43_17]
MSEPTPNTEIDSTNALNPAENNKSHKFITKKVITYTVAVLLLLTILTTGVLMLLKQGGGQIITRYKNGSQGTTNTDDKTARQDTGFLPSTKGSIELLQTPDKINTFHSTHYLFGNIETDGDLFHIEVSRDGKVTGGYTLKVNNKSLVVQTDLGGNGFVTHESSVYKKFYYPINDLTQGDNSIAVKLYTDDSKVKLIDEKFFTITRTAPTYVTDITFYSQVQKVNPEELFKQAGIDFEKDRLWEYVRDEDSFIEGSSELLYGKSEKWTDYSLEAVGEIGVNNSKVPLYRFFYTYQNSDLFAHTGAFNFYISNNKAYFIINSLFFSGNITPIYLFYMNSSPYLFNEVVTELGKIKIDANNFIVPSTFIVGGIGHYNPSNVEGEILYTYKSYVLYDSHIIYDRYGNWRYFELTPSYFKDDRYGGNDNWNESLYRDFNKIGISLDDGKNPDNFYSPFWYWCGGSRGYRVLPDSDAKYLELVGKTATGENVYIYAKDMPFPENTHLLPALTKDDLTNQVIEEGWQDFLENQKDTYPVLVIKNIFDEWVVYIDANNIFVPGC